FPMDACLSGWVMRHGEPAIVPDVFADPRVPVEVYRETFVRSVVLVPIRRAAPIGAIGVYWAKNHAADPSEVRLLQALADITSVTIQNVELYCELEARVKHRTAELQEANARLAETNARLEEANARLEGANRDLEAFAGAVAHDLRSPVTALNGFAELLDRAAGSQLDEVGRRYLSRVRAAAGRLAGIIDALLSLSRTHHAPLQRRPVDMSALATAALGALRAAEPARDVEVVVGPLPTVDADEPLVRLVLENLLANAWKFTRAAPHARIEIGADTSGPVPVFYVRDDGLGLSGEEIERLFRPFYRGANAAGIEGHGLGLATVERAVARHGGRIWAEDEGKGATFPFTLAPA
ncbi:MAG: sensor histidine kinase, partial [Myxococcota bacterium]